ncbi:uncharacterized protein LOC133038460 [Cannabis sativa]|uniref:uncharacterized protein LOC133038460 n=1 Tax=Cannabis sativa TaxID=3483 RepID=UPI0029C9CEB1|nr:uncharacterized protein LOC133038460 [Cannabis sativa]
MVWSLGRKEDKPQVNYLLNKYCNQQNFWSVSPKSNDSYLWKSLLEVKDVVLRGSMVVAGKGDSSDMWIQPWIQWLSYEEFRALMEGLNRRLITARTIADISCDGAWNRELVFQIFRGDLGQRIVEIPRILLNHHDQVVWRNHLNGIFTVKSVYCADQSFRFSPRSKIWTSIWKSDVHPWMAMFMWRVLNKVLPTRDKLHFSLDKECLLCGEGLKSCLYIFRECSAVKILWIMRDIPIFCTNIPGNNMKEYVENLLSIFPGSDRSSLINYMGCLFQNIWNARNDKLFKGSNTFFPLIHKKVSDLWNEVSNAEGAKDYVTSIPEGMQRTVGSVNIILMTDASWLEVDACGFSSCDGQFDYW